MPYPHVERRVVVHRPSVVVSREATGPDGLLIWTLMVTNAERPAWPGDIEISQWKELGLIIPSKIRTAKISAVQNSQAHFIARLPMDIWNDVRARVRKTIC